MTTEAIPQEFSALIEDLRRQVASLTEKVARLDHPAAPAPLTAPAPAPEPKAEAISEEEVLAISAAVAAFLGVRAHIRQIRLVSSRSWAQEGRVSIQASHRLHG